MSTATPMPRPGGRTARVRAAVLDAADALLGDDLGTVTVRALAERSGVSEPTIYRRWRSAENVLVDAAVRHLTRQSPIPATGDLRADLLAWATQLEAAIASPAGLRFLLLVIRARAEPGAGPGETLAPFMDQRTDQLRALLEADAAPAWLTVDRLLDEVLAPLYVRQLLGYRAGRDARALVDALLAR
jgi:AcrR family transcriptional regulator